MIATLPCQKVIEYTPGSRRGHEKLTASFSTEFLSPSVVVN